MQSLRKLDPFYSMPPEVDFLVTREDDTATADPLLRQMRFNQVDRLGI
jgi:hypothetical protein